MTGAATPSCKHGVFGVAVVIAAAALAGSGSPADAATRSPGASRTALPALIQAVVIERGLAPSVSMRWLEARRSQHTTAVLLDPARLGPELFRRVRRTAWGAGLRVLVPLAATDRAAGAATCARLAKSGKPCLLSASTPRSAIVLSRIRGSVVAVRLPNLAAFQALGASGHGRIVGIVPLGGAVDSVAWLRAVTLARSSARLDLAVAPRAGVSGAKGLARYEQLLNPKPAAGVDPRPGPGGGADPGGGGGGAAGGGGASGGGGTQADTLAPTAPLGLTKTTATATSIRVSWSSATDNVGVVGYGLYLAGGSVTSSPQTSATFVALACGTSYSIGIDAYDAAGNRSAKTVASFATSTCGGGGVVDTQPPAVPSGLHTTGITTGSIALAWNASADNVGVAGYYLSIGGVRVATTTNLSYSFGSLACGTNYTLAISAFDAAGNTSNPAFASTDEVTSACAGPPPPPPSGLASVFIATNGSDSNPCTAVAACASFNRAYRVAQPGQVVEVAGGTYPIQSIANDSSKTSQADVVFQPAAGVTVTIACDTTSTIGGGTIGGQTCLDVSASHITFDGGSAKAFKSQSYSVHGFSYQGRIDTERGASDITFRNMDVGAVAVGSSQTTITHSDLGPSVDPLNNRQAGGSGNVWQDNLIHDYVIENGGHMECVTWDAGTNITFEYNEFRSCEVFSIFAKPTDNISGTIDHNVFWNPRGVTTNDDVKVSLGSGATRCDVATTSNWISEDTYMDCPGATESGTTTHSPSIQPPSPIR